MRGSDGALFVYDCTEKRSKNDFSEHNDWYQRACGFDKPWYDHLCGHIFSFLS